MDISFGCPGCQQHMVIDEAGAGLLVPCPKCGQEIRVPSLVANPTNVSRPDKERTVALKWTPPASSTGQKPK
jgi:DNA-directed RNA polymerase subunit M/transcription elongation factor TFIIS